VDVTAQLERVGDVIDVAQRFRPAGEMLGPVPFLQELLRKGIAVGIAFGIEAGARIAVPVPGAADVGELYLSFLVANAEAFAKGVERLEINVWGLPYACPRSNIRSNASN
jgi:hypothetical protein